MDEELYGSFKVGVMDSIPSLMHISIYILIILLRLSMGLPIGFRVFCIFIPLIGPAFLLVEFIYEERKKRNVSKNSDTKYKEN